MGAVGIDEIAAWTAWLAPLGVAGAWAIERLLPRRHADHAVGIIVPHTDHLSRAFAICLAGYIILPVLSPSGMGLAAALVVQAVAVWFLLPTGDPRDLPWPSGPLDAFKSVVAGTCGVLVLGSAISVVVAVLARANPGAAWPALPAIGGGGQEVATRLLIACVAIPFCEEVLFRYGLLGWLVPRLGRSGACIASAIVFSAVHLDDRLFLARIVGGAAMGWLYIRRRDIVAPFIVHALTNLCIHLLPSLF